jgi:predicted O-linked N-acetylglucosamine transferase (SPINDLY family)
MLKWLFAKPSAASASGERARELVAAGNRAESEGRVAEACELYRQAVLADPAHAPGYLNLGAALEQAGEREAARAAYRALLEREPDNPFANYNLAGMHLADGAAPAIALDMLRKSLRARGDFPEAQVALSNALDLLGRTKEAVEAVRAAVKLRPDFAGAWYNLGILLRKLEQLDEAEDALRRALELDKGFAPAHRALCSLLRAEGRNAEALAGYRAAPKTVELASGELLTLLLSDTVSDEELFARHRTFGERLEAAHAPGGFAREKNPEKKLRVGFVSSDLYRHPVALFLIPVLANRSFEAFCYMTGSNADEVSAELRELAEGWRDVGALSDAALAAKIREDAIDVLVDLTGHAGECRLGVFALQAAPVQASWLGYLHTSGLERMQYRICDPHTDPAQVERFYTEKLVRLPATQWCYRPFLTLEHAAQPPCAKSGFVTFGSFNQAAKISPATRRRWNEILRRLPDARLLVAGAQPGRGMELLAKDLAAGGVDPARIRFVPRAPLDRYLPLFDEVDIALDTSPYSGGTSTCDALWMGVPVLTEPGTRSVSRSAAGVLSVAGLADWIARPGGYVALAIEKARDRKTLGALRASLRERMRASPLMDEKGFARDLESAFRGLWREWCENRGHGA